MKMINKIKNITALFFCSALIFSCTNFMNAGAKKSSAADKNAVVMFYGTIQDFSGAVPEDVAKLCADLKGGAERSAVPVYSFDTEIQYFAVAECGSDKRDGTFENDSNIFSVALGSGKKWKITCGICENGNTDNIFMSETKEFDISTANPVLSYTFTPKPGMTGNGKIDLEFKFNNAGSYRIDYFNAIINGQNYSGDILGDNGYLIINQLQSGIYDVTFKFYNNNDTPDSAYDDVMLYYTVQTIAVFDKMTTNTWVSDGNITIDGNKLSVTDDVIEAFEDNSIYVGSTNKGQAASDTNAGTVYTPFKTLQRAIDKIALTGNGKDYTIFVYGTVQGCTKIPDTIVKGTNGKASSITITGISNAVLDGNVGNTPKGDGHVLWIQSNVPVTIRDIKVTGGNTIYGTDDQQGSGGGICIAPQADDSKVVIDGCNITGNHASYGGGIYIKNSKVKITNTNIKYNYADTNAAYDGGGGIFIYDGAEATLGSGCVIESNTARMGGGIEVIGAKLFLDGAEIKSNKALNYSSNDTGGGWGGGIYLGTEGGAETGTKVFITRGKISGNIAEQNGGGICFKSDGAAEEVSTLSITGGTIENNKAEENGVAGEGGAIWLADPSNAAELEFILGGSAYIPAGTGDKNDIYLCSTEIPIKLAGELTEHQKSDKDQIALQLKLGNSDSDFKHGSIVVQSEPLRDLTNNDNKCFKLSASQKAGGLDLTLSSDCKSIKLDKPIFVRQGGLTAEQGADGTREKPFASIQAACGAMTSTSLDYTILVDGINPTTGYSMSLLGAQTIPEGTRAASITIMGANGLYPADHSSKAGEPKDAIDGRGCTTAAVLTAECACPVILGNIKITNGDRNGTGGGVERTNGDLYIQEGTLITGNKAHGGLGVYISGCNLYMSGGKISSNVSTVSVNANGTGGGISAFIKDGKKSNVFIYGSAVIGGVDKDSPQHPTDRDNTRENGGNYAYNILGGGVGCDGSNLYLGYKSAKEDESPNEEAEWTGGIYGNYSYWGGGVYVEDGKLYMNSGEIAYNYLHSKDYSGGGVTIRSFNSQETSACFGKLSGGKIHHNYSRYRGGGVDIHEYNYTRFEMTGGEIYANTAEQGGGGVSVDGPNDRTQAAWFIMSGGSIYGNKVTFNNWHRQKPETIDSGSGGGIYNYGRTFIYGSAVIGKDGDPVVAKESESVSNSATLSGGGIYSNGWLYLGYSSATGTNRTPTSEDVAEWTGGVYCNKAQRGGGIYGSFWMSSGTIKGNYSYYNSFYDSVFNQINPNKLCYSGCGGGVSVNLNDVYMTGGLITKNHSESNEQAKGSGVHLAGSGVQFHMSGPACVLPESDGSNEIYFGNTNNTITVAGALNPTKTGKTGGEAADYAACIEPKDYSQVLLTAANGVNLSDYAPLFKIKPQNGDSTLVVDGLNGLEYGIGADGKYGSMIYVTESSDDVCDAIMGLVSASSQDNPVNICFTTDFAPSRNVQHGNDSGYTYSDAILRVPAGKALNITASKPITIKKAYSNTNRPIIYCENGFLSIGPNITLDGNKQSDYAVVVHGTEATLSGCEIKNCKSTGIQVMSGSWSNTYGFSAASSKLTINSGTKIHDCGCNSSAPGIVISQENSYLYLNGGEIYNCTEYGIRVVSRGKVICPDRNVVSIHDNKTSRTNGSNGQVYIAKDCYWATSESNLNQSQFSQNTTWATFP